jgi:acetyl esterase/lipase
MLGIVSVEARWPAQLHDAEAAVRRLRSRADELGVDPVRFAAWGESAGGHPAELLGPTRDDPALEGGAGVSGPSSSVAAVAAGSAPGDVPVVAPDTGTDPDDPRTAHDAQDRTIAFPHDQLGRSA